ncbi:MAG: exosortase/archaeosortase family protein [Acidobacteriaceae bacterium]
MTDFQRHWTAFVSLAVIAVLPAWHPFLQTLSLSRHNDEYTHILLILPLVALIVFLERKSVRQSYRWGSFSGPALMAIAAVSAFAAYFYRQSLAPDVALALEVSALVMWWIGSFVLCFGRGVAQAFSFTILLLLGLVPLPGIVLDRIIAVLQIASAWSAHALFALCGVPVVQNGILLTIPNLTLQVAHECSSIRSSSMLLVTTIVVAEVLLRSPWKKALLIALAIPLSVAKNGLRIFVIAMLGTRVDPAYLTGNLHREGGILFFALALICIFAVLAILQRGETKTIHSGLPGPSAATTGD